MPGLPKIVLERLKSKTLAPEMPGGHAEAAPPEGFAHPDANLLAAFAERNLSESERSQVLNHLAQCAGCREMVALMLPAAADLTLPERAPARPRWRTWPAPRWGVLAAALAALAVALVWYPASWKRRQSATHLTGSETKRPATLMATARPPAAPAENAPAAPETRELPRGRRATLGAAKPSPPPHAHSAPRPSPPPDATRGANAGLELQAAAGVVSAAARSRAVSADLKAGPPGGVSALGSNVSGSLASVPKRARSQQARLPSMAFRAGLASAGAQLGALWTISADGQVQRSDDQGATWQDVHIADQVTFRVVQAMGREVWAGGSGGALYHSSDGGSVWSRAGLSEDGRSATEAIVAIISSTRDPGRISVRTVSGVEWTTEDGGRHWQRVPSSQ